MDGERVLCLERKVLSVPQVNLWPRPVQDPHPPILIPGGVSSSTWDYCHERNYPYANLSYFGGKSAEQIMDRFWDRASAKGRDGNPYRAAFLQIVAVAETDHKAEEEYGKHVEYFYHKLLHLPTAYISPPGNADYKSLLNIFMSGKNLMQVGDLDRTKTYEGEGHDRQRICGRRQSVNGSPEA
jgi:alkanesulfonate monooxygenase SsuD/methylene tetrahydromethanopterin reductase-like flavin-dependent oxidoreductase (luciferase family)